MYTVMQRAKIAAKGLLCATLEEALEVANRKIASATPGMRTTLTNDATGERYDEAGIAALTRLKEIEG